MEWLFYLLKVSACSALFFAFYVVALRKLTFFKANRFYLLFSLLLSFVIPALNVEIEKVLPPLVLQSGTPEALPGTQVQPMEAAPVTTAPGISWTLWLSVMYIAVVAVLFVLTLWRLLQLLKHARVYSRVGNLKLIRKDDGFTNCSFFNYVFIGGEQLTAAEFSLLLKHEEVHARQYHSADKLLLHVAKAVLWFNPIVYFYDKELEQLHEYEADSLTSSSFGTKFYANLLLRLAIQDYSDPLVHNFVKSPIKERIKMLYQSKSTRMKKLSYVLALPIATGLVWGFAVNIVYAQHTVIQGQNVPVKEVPTITVKGVQAENFTSKNGVVVKKGAEKIMVAGVEVNAVNDVAIVAKGTTLTGQPLTVVNGYEVAKGTGNNISVFGVQNDAVAIVDGKRINSVSAVTVNDLVPKALNGKVAGVNGVQIDDLPRISVRGNVAGTQVASISVAKSGGEIATTRVSGSVAGIAVGKAVNVVFNEEDPFYQRYSEIGNDGKAHDVVLLRTAEGSWASAEIPKDGKVMIYINGVAYSESQAESLTKAMIKNLNMVSACEKETSDFAKRYPSLVGKYDAVLELKTNK